MYANGFHVKDNKTRRTLLTGTSSGGLYTIPATSGSSACASFFGETTNQLVWHSRLGHPSPSIFRILHKKHHLPILGPLNFNKQCHVCPMGKSSRLQFNNRTFTASSPLDLLHLDLWGSSPVPSNSGYRFYLSIVDDCTRYVWFYPLLHKSDAFTVFLNFKKMVENLLSRSIKVVQSDGGGEFVNRHFKTFFTKTGIIHRLSCPYTPQQNGTVERKHRQIVEMGLCLLAQSHVPLSFWLEAFSTAVYLINRLPTPLLDHCSPYEKLLNRTKIIVFLRCLVLCVFLI